MPRLRNVVPMTTPPKPRRRPLRTVFIILGVLLALVLVAAVAALAFIGPRFGIWVIPLSPKAYAEHALESLDQGYYATGPEWDAERAKVVAAGESAASYDDLYPVLQEATEVAGGKHSFFLTPDEVQAGSASAAAEFTAPTVTTNDGITTITVPRLGSVSNEQQQQYADAAAHGIRDAAATTCGWVVDLRDNRGGNMFPMIAGIAPLVPDGPAMTFRSRAGSDQAVHVEGGGAGFGLGPAIKTDVTQKITGQNIAVLYDDMVASPGEATAMVFRGIDGVRSFGTPTAGYTSANTSVPMPAGGLMVLTQAVYVDRDGVNLNEEPMQPDEPTSAEAAPAAAEAWLRQGSCR